MLEPRKARCSTTRNTVLCEIPAFVSARRIEELINAVLKVDL